MRKLQAYEETKNYVLGKALQNGMFNESYKQVADSLHLGNLATVKNYINRMVNDGLIEIAKAPKRGMGGSGVYKIPTQQPLGFQIINFQGVDLVLQMSEIGWVMSKDDLSVATSTDDTVISKILTANKELFVKNTIVVEGQLWLNFKSIMTYMLKLNVDRVISSKKESLVQFTELIVSKMCDSVLSGKVVLLDKEHIQIRTNLSCLTNLDSDQVEQMFHTIELDVNKVLEGFTKEIKTANLETIHMSKKLTTTTNLLESEKNRYQGCVSEVQMLKEKLLERQN